jgi:hypothetical protein
MKEELVYNEVFNEEKPELGLLILEDIRLSDFFFC